MEGSNLPIQSVLFDFDGTLADTMPVIVAAFQQVFAEFEGRRLSWEQVIALFGPPEGEIFKHRLRDPDQAAAALSRYLQVYRELHPSRVVCAPEVPALLAELQRRGVPLGLVTGKGRTSAGISLAALGLQHLFTVVVTGEDVRRPKPDPEGIQLALEQLGTPPDQALYVGDMDADVVAGRQAGVTTIGAAWYPGTGHGFTVPPDHLFTRVADFRAYLEAALNA